MKIFVFLFLLVFAHTTYADLYKEVTMPDGPFKGQILDTSKIRGFVVINGVNVVLPEHDPNYFYIANVTHNDKFYVAKVSPNSPQKVSFVYEKFNDMQGGHADLIYFLDRTNPMELLYEIKDTKKGYKLIKLQNPIVLDEVLLTAEAVKVVGDKTPLKEGGLNNSFAMAYRMTSIPERLIPTVLGDKRRTTVYDMKLDTASTQKSFYHTVIQQDQIGMSKNYHLITNNCITSAIYGLINGLSDEEQIRLKIQIAKTIARLKTLSHKDITEEEINEMIQEYAEILGDKVVDIKSESIHKKQYFLKWLTKEQRELSKRLLKEQESALLQE